MKDKIKKIVDQMNNVSFVELMKMIPGSSGDRIVYTDNDSLIIWEGVSEKFAVAIEELLSDSKLILKLTSEIAYLADGKTLNYPIAKSVRNYLKPHWLPVVLCAI